MPDRPGWLPRFLGWVAGVFCRIERRGPPVPDGPVIVAANHPSSLLDPLVIFRTAGRATRPLAKAPLFDQPVVGFMLRALGGLPVYRRQDDAGQMHRNEDTFRAAIDALLAGSAIQIFPEGITHSEPGLAELRTGAARIALAAANEAGWNATLRIVPVGLTYRHKQRFRGSALASVGEAIRVADWKAEYEADPQQAARSLTAAIAERLRGLIVELSDAEDEPLIETAERMWAREKGLAGWREPDPMAERLPRLRAFARGLAWLRLNDPERHRTLERRVRTYRAWLDRLGAREGDVPPRYPLGTVLRYVLHEGLPLLIGFPFAALGAVVWYPVWLAPRIAVARIRPEPEAVSSYKLIVGFLTAPVLWAAVVAIAAFLWGWRGALLATLAVPLLGAITLAWGERFLRVRQDADLFFNVLRRPRLQQHLARRRAVLLGEFEAVQSMAAEAPEAAGGRTG